MRETMLECENLVKEFHGSKALKGISFKAEGSGLFGFLGANGAGKTTAIRIFAGLSKPDSGIVRIGGRDIRHERERIASEIGYLPQHYAFFEYMTGREWLLFTAGLFSIDPKTAKERAERLLQECGIAEAADRKIGGYSGGMKQRLGIAQALINSPKLLILDEPVSALDPGGRYEVLELLSALKKKMTIFMSSHILEDVEKVADHIIIIDRGELVHASSMKELLTEYTAPVIKVELLEEIPNLAEIVEQEPWAERAEWKGAEWEFTVRDLETAKKRLPGLLAGQGAVITKYVIGTAALEDIFLRLVKR